MLIMTFLRFFDDFFDDLFLLFVIIRYIALFAAALTEQWDDAKVATERTIMSKIYKAAFRPNGPLDAENDK